MGERNLPGGYELLHFFETERSFFVFLKLSAAALLPSFLRAGSSRGRNGLGCELQVFREERVDSFLRSEEQSRSFDELWGQLVRASAFEMVSLFATLKGELRPM